MPETVTTQDADYFGDFICADCGPAEGEMLRIGMSWDCVCKKCFDERAKDPDNE